MCDSLLDEARKEIDQIDAQMATLFEQRMAAVKKVAAYKVMTGMPVFDASREAQILAGAAKRVQNDALCSYYRDFLQAVMDISKAYQSSLIFVND